MEGAGSLGPRLLREENKMRKHLSVTQMKMFLQCPLKYYFRYKEGIKVKPNSSLTMGRSVHKAIEEFYRKKMKGETIDIKDAFAFFWDAESKETEFKKDENPGELKDEGVRLGEKYAEEIAPTIKPREIEKEFELVFENVAYTLKGVIDLIEADGTIVDHKCSKRSPNQADIDRDIQLSAYQVGYKSLYGKDPAGLRLDYIVRNKTPKTIQARTERSQKNLDRFLKLLGYVSKAIEQDIYYPNESMMCSCCGYKAICKKW